MSRAFPALLGLALALAVGARAASAAVEKDLDQAAAAGRPVFLIVTEGAAKGTDLARKVCAEAQKLVEGSLVLEMDRADPANAAVVKKHRLASAPVPLILVIGPNGVAAGGAKPSQLTAGKLARMVPTPAKAAHVQALSDGKATFFVFSRAAMPGRAAVLEACASAVAALKGKAVVLAVDLDDAREAALLEDMKIDGTAREPVTVVVTAKGQRTASLVGLPTVKALTDATVPPAGGCAPGQCGPGGCK